jgi:flagella basal body P-ring formation protein FlgA
MRIIGCERPGPHNQTNDVQFVEDRIKWAVLFFFSLLSVYFVLVSVSAAAWKVNDILKTYLADNYPWDNYEIGNIRVIGELSDEVPEKIVVEKGPIGRAIFSFYSSSGKRTVVKAIIEARSRIVKSKRPFRRGHVLKKDDVYVATMGITKMPSGTVKDPEKIIGKSLKRSVAANIPLVMNMIEKYRVVKRGKLVKLIIGDEGFNISAAGKTKEKGYVGRPVKAVNLSSNKIVTGVLIDENTVRVKL